MAENVRGGRAAAGAGSWRGGWPLVEGPRFLISRRRATARGWAPVAPSSGFPRDPSRACAPAEFESPIAVEAGPRLSGQGGNRRRGAGGFCRPAGSKRPTEADLRRRPKPSPRQAAGPRAGPSLCRRPAGGRAPSGLGKGGTPKRPPPSRSEPRRPAPRVPVREAGQAAAGPGRPGRGRPASANPGTRDALVRGTPARRSRRGANQERLLERPS